MYADWLTARGDRRGAFIAAQCALAAAPRLRPRWLRLRERCQGLAASHEGDWTPKIALTGATWTFDRGFVAGIEASASTLLSTGSALIEAAPTLTSATTRRFDVAAEAFLSWPVLPHLRSLTLRYLPHHTPNTLRALLNDARLAHLEHVGISHSYLMPDDYEVLARSLLLPRLARLWLPLCNARNAHARTLMSASSSLQALSLANGQLGTDGAIAIATSQHAHTLRELDLSWNRLGVKAARALARSEVLSHLEILDLSHCQIGDAGCRALAEGRLSSLEVLWLEHSRVTSVGARHLVDSAALSGLVTVALDRSTLDPPTLAALQDRFGDGLVLC